MMRSRKIIPALLLIILFITGCNTTDFFIKGSGINKSAEFNNTNFDSLSVSSLFKVYIEPGQNYEVKLIVDEKLINHVRVDQFGGHLRLHTEGVLNISNADLQARIKMPTITKLEMSGKSTVKIGEGFDLSQTFKIDISGNSKLQGIVRVRDIALDLSGNSYAELSGTGRDLRADISGNSKCDMRKIRFRDVLLDCSGMSKVYVNLNGDLEADASGLSEIYYSGLVNKKVIDISGGAKIVGL